MKEVKSLLFFLLSIPTFIFGQVVTDGLILNLDTRSSNSYSGSGNTWNDISGNNYNATIIGGTSYSNNQFTLVCPKKTTDFNKRKNSKDLTSFIRQK